MGTFIIKHWLIALPTIVTGFYLLRVAQRLYAQKKERQPVPILIPQKD